MKLPKLTAFLLTSCFIILNSCTNNSQEIFEENHYVGYLAMAGTQEVPAVTTAGTGTILATYNKLSRVLNYTINFSGLSGNATGAGIYGTAGTGFSTSTILQSFSSFPAKPSGSFSGTLFFDGLKIKEEDLLAGKYYVNIRTAANANGEIRGQLVLLKY